MIVADASLLAHLLIPSPESALAEDVYRKDPEWSAPVLWRSELRSVLLKHMRHSGMNIELATAVVEKALLVIRDRETLPPNAGRVGSRYSFSTCRLTMPNTWSWRASSVSHFSPSIGSFNRPLQGSR